MPRRRAVRALKHSSLWVYRLCLYALVASVLLVATCMLGVRYWLLPNIDRYSPQISAAISQATRQRIVIGAIRGDWDGLRPRLQLHDVRLYDTQGQERMALDAVDSTVSWTSVLALEPLFHSIELTGLSFEVRRDASGGLHIAGIALGDEVGGDDAGLADWLLRQHRVTLRDSEVTWVDETLGGTPMQLKQVEVEVQRVFRRNRFALRAVPPLEVASPVDLRGDLDGRTVGNLREWKGQLYLQIGYADLAALRQWVPLPVQIDRGAGGLEVWVDLQAGQVRAVTADVGLSGVRTRLRADLPELELERLQGRLAWQIRPDYLGFSARALSFATPDGLELAPTDVGYVRTGAEGAPNALYEVQFDAVDVAAVTRLIDRVPLDETLRTRLAALQPRGTVRDGRVSWRGSVKDTGEYAVKADFERLAVRSAGYVPGFAKVSGALAADQNGGSLILRADASTVEMPEVFVEPLPLNALNAKVSWSMRDGQPLVRLDSLVFASVHMEGRLSGTYEAQAGGPGRIDLTGGLARLEGAELWRYVPTLVHVDVRDWLRTAIGSGQFVDARFTLRGDLQRFPFADGHSGVFEVVAGMRNGTLAYAPHWPPIEDISGTLRVQGPRLVVTVDSGRVFGARGTATATLADIGSHEPVLQVKGEGEGGSADFLRFVAESPIEGGAGTFSRSVQMSGRGRLTVSLDVPLKHAIDTQVSGRYRFADNVLLAGAGVPRLEQLGGVLSFTREEANVRDGTVRVLGMPARFTLDRQQQGAGVLVRGSGRAEMAGLRQELGMPWMSQLAGTTDWTATVAISEGSYDLTIDSNLRGVGSLLPPPLAKPAAGTLAFRLERRPRGADQDLVLFKVGEILSGQLAYKRSDLTRVAQGELRLGGPAPAPQRDGMWLAGQLDYFDADRWLAVMGGPRADEQTAWAGLDLRANRVVAFSRDWTDMQIEGRRRDNAWQIGVTGREAAGTMTWNSTGRGSLAGRFSRLFVPASGPVLQPAGVSDADRNMPSLDIIADEFRVGERHFGRLVLQAVPEQNLWRIEQADLHSPEGRISLTGTWEAWSATPTTRLDVQAEVGDIGGFFARLKLPEGIKGGSGRLEGQLSWTGPPSAPDLATLSGSVSIDAKNGQFVKVEPGIGKLIGVLSLQALPRRVTLDFRDIFSEGFTFDEIRAGAQIVRGVAHTDNFRMTGTAARVDMKGDLDLAHETQNLQVRVIPSLSESVALGAAIVNPAIGLATLFAQKALKDPINQMVSTEYVVTGTWSDPVIANKRRDPPNDGKAGRR